jgi:hypothetical protein
VSSLLAVVAPPAPLAPEQRLEDLLAEATARAVRILNLARDAGIASDPREAAQALTEASAFAESLASKINYAAAIARELERAAR